MADSPRQNTSAALCKVCGKLVAAEDQAEHLRSSHLGPHYFWFDMRRHRTEFPSMRAGDLKQLVDARPDSFVVQERPGGEQDIYYADSEAIDLTREPHLFTSTAGRMQATYHGE